MRGPCPLVTGAGAGLPSSPTEKAVRAGRGDGPALSILLGTRRTLTRRVAYGTRHTTLAAGHRSTLVPGRRFGARRRARGPRPLEGSARVRADSEARRHASRRRGNRSHWPRPPQQLELLLGAGVRPHLREPHDV